jgi:thiamine pyrophosphokinase
LLIKKACIFLNGKYANEEPLIALAGGDALVIGVDGGTRHLAGFGLQPQIIIGDMDSVSEAEIIQFGTSETRILRHPPQKDETDFELALDQVIQQECTEILVFGALGGRSDHLITNLLLPIVYLDKAKIRLFHGVEEITYITSLTTIQGQAGDIISLVPLSGDVTGVKTIGLLYPLNNETLHQGKSRGVSNELLENIATVSIESGVLLCIHCHQISSMEQEKKL